MNALQITYLNDIDGGNKEYIFLTTLVRQISVSICTHVTLSSISVTNLTIVNPSPAQEYG